MTTPALLDTAALRADEGPLDDPVSSGRDDPARCESAGPVDACIAVGALAVVGATAVGLRWASRPAAPRTITMGPGGWVSFKGLPPPRTGGRPWWAVLLRAQRCT